MLSIDTISDESINVHGNSERWSQINLYIVFLCFLLRVMCVWWWCVCVCVGGGGGGGGGAGAVCVCVCMGGVV